MLKTLMFTKPGVLAGLCLFAGIHLTVPAATAEKPNIIFVLFDDMGYGEPTCYRPESKLKTPQIDRLAAAGMRFTDAHSAAAVCTPTRYGVITGRYPSRIGQYGVLQTYNPPIIPESRLTVASFLKQHGYETACIGKWHMGLKWQEVNEPTRKGGPLGARIISGPNQLGFDYFYGYTHAGNFGMLIEQDAVESNVEEVENQPRMITKAVEWLEKRENNKPFFLYFPMCPPHTPVVPAPEFEGKSGAVDEVKKDPKYGDWVYQGDHMLGQILDTLEKKGLAENTLVMVSSDNGAAGRPYAPLRGNKTSIYEGGHRVPFLVRWPGKIKAGSLCDDTICLNDLMSTCAEIVGAKLPDTAGEDSVSILPDLLGTAKGPVREAIIHQDYKGNLAIRQGPWKLIFFKDGKHELYNLQKDLSETTDVAEANPDMVNQLTTLMKRLITQGRSTVGAPQKNEADISLDKAGAGNKDHKGKKGKLDAKKEVALAKDPHFD